jgi:hemerythrin
MNDDLLSWKKDYSTGIHEIDLPHQDLVRLTNEMLRLSADAALAEQFFYARVMPGMEALEAHFTNEEKLMQEKNYAKYKEHKLKHDRMLGDLKEVIIEIQNGKRKLELLNLALYLREWVIKHIYETDLPMAALIK